MTLEEAREKGIAVFGPGTEVDHLEITVHGHTVKTPRDWIISSSGPDGEGFSVYGSGATPEEAFGKGLTFAGSVAAFRHAWDRFLAAVSAAFFGESDDAL